MMEDVASRADEKAKLHSLVQELTSELSADNEERAALLQQLSDVNREWEELQQQLRYTDVCIYINFLFLVTFSKFNSIYIYILPHSH